MTARDESMRRHPTARLFTGTAQTLTPTFSLGGVEFPLTNAQQADDSYGFVEHLGIEPGQITIRCRTEDRVQVPPFSYEDFVRVLAEAARLCVEAAK